MTQTALITGGGRGIGYGIAAALARERVNIAILDMLPEEAVAANLATLRQSGVQVLYCRGDVTCAEDRRTALASVEKQLGVPNVLVNNAGVAPKVRADILEATEESYDFVMGVNLKGPYFLTQLVANRMVAKRKGDPAFPVCVINISSVSATVASPSRGEYCLSKAGVSMATKLWAARLGEFGIPVYEIRPGVIQTAMTAVVKEKYDKLIGDGLCLQKRWGFPEDIAKAVALLVRGDLPYSTGQVILVDGGMTLPRL